MVRIVREGIEQQVFHEDFDMRVFRDAILGLLDFETLQSLASNEMDHATSDFEDILRLILPAVTRRTLDETSNLNKGSRILESAEAVFAEKGYEKAIISEIAKLSRVAEGTIYEYYQNNEDILFSIPSDKFDNYLKSLDEIFEIRTPLRKLRRLIRHHSYIFMTESSFLKVFYSIYGLMRDFIKPRLTERFKNIMK